MLWKKESGQPGAIYIDIFTPNTQHWDSISNSLLRTIEQKPHPKKSNAIALEKRKKGNDEFRDTASFKAMALYSDSLRFAHPESEHISLAYANRAACFLKMKMYDECLIDIEYALAAGYPAHLRPKLDERKARCLKEMQESPLHPCEKWSIEPNEKFPFLSNKVMIQRNEKGDYSVVATTDIDVGLSIVVEDPFYVHIRDEFEIHCNICSKEFCNLVPCEKCAVAMFCPECQENFLHEHECGLNFGDESSFNSDVMGLVRGILLPLKMFATADELMVFVEQILKRPNELPANMLDDRSKYHAYFNSPNKQNVDSFDKMRLLTYPVYKTLLRIPRVNEMFRTTKHRRFLMHLICHHAKIPQNTAGLSTDVGAHSSLGPPVRIRPVMRSYIKHSCHPNVDFVINGGTYNWYSIKPIKKGEQLFISCAPFGMNSTNERKKHLLDLLNINCECSRCQGRMATSAQRQQLVSDPTFRYINANVKSLRPLKLCPQQIQPLKEACVTILQKYGDMDWCEEMDYVLLCFRTLHPLARELSSHTDGQM